MKIRFEALVFGELLDAGFSNQLATQYSTIQRIQMYMETSYVQVFNRMWEEHPERSDNNGQTTGNVEVNIELAAKVLWRRK